MDDISDGLGLNLILADFSKRERARSEAELRDALSGLEKKLRAEFDKQRQYDYEVARRGWEAEVWARMPQLAKRQYTPKGHSHAAVGGGADCMFSDLISTCWEGPEGQEFTNLTGCTFQVWSNVTDWEADLQTRTAAAYAAYLCPGTYAESVTFNGFAANFEIHLIGGGIGATLLGTTTGGGVPITISDNDPIYRFSNMTLRGTEAGDSMLSTVTNIKIHCDRVHMNRQLEIDTTYGYFTQCEIIGGIQISTNQAPDNMHFFGGIIGEQMTWNNNASMYGPFFHGVDFEEPGVAGSIVFTGTGAVRAMRFNHCKLGGGAFLTVNAPGGGYMEATFTGCDMGEPGTNGVIYVQEIGASTNSGRFRVVNCDFTEPGADYPYMRFDDTPNNTPYLVVVGNEMPNTVVTQPIIATPGEGSIIGPNWPQPQGTSGLAEATGAGVDHRWTLIDAGGSTHANIQHPQIKLGTSDPNGQFPVPSAANQRPAPRGALFFDLTNELLYANLTDGVDWVIIGGPGLGGTAPNTGTYVVATDQDATLPNSRLLTEGAGIDLADGGAAGNLTVSVDLSELSWIKEEGTALPTQRGSLDFRGQLLQAVDDGVDDTAIFGGYREYSAIVDSNQYNALATTVPVYTTLQAAITANHRSILFRDSTDAVAITSVGNTKYILGDSLFSAAIPVNLTVDSNCLISNVAFSNVAVTLSGAGATLQACLLTGSATATLSGAGASLVACAGVSLSAATAISVTSADNRIQASRFQSNSCATTVIDLTSTSTYSSIVGNVWISSSETGVFLTNNGAGNPASINGNVFDMSGNNAITGAVVCNIGTNLTGNSFIMPNWLSQNGITKTIVSNVGRGIVSGNTFIQAAVSSATVTVKHIVTGSLSGALVTGNYFQFGAGTSANPVVIACENTAGGMQFTNNLILSLVAGSQFLTVLNNTNLSYVYRGNIVTTSASNPNYGRVAPVRNTAGTAAISGLSYLDSNAAMPDFQAYQYK